MIRFMNWLTDMDWGWFPFLHLRPRKDERMTTGHVGKMSLHYGIIMWALYIALRSLHRVPFSFGELFVLPFFCVMFFFVGYRLTFAIAWNIRASQLQASPEIGKVEVKTEDDSER